MAIRKYVEEYYPGLSCDCKRDVKLVSEQRVSKNTFNVDMSFRCASTCRDNHIEIIFTVDVSDSEGPDVICAVNSWDLNSYKKFANLESFQ